MCCNDCFYSEPRLFDGMLLTCRRRGCETLPYYTCSLYWGFEKPLRTEQKSREVPFKPGSVTWSLYFGEWDDLTQAEIAEVLGVTPDNIRRAIYRVRDNTGKTVIYRKVKEK